MHFGISNFKIYPVYTSSFKYIFPDLNTTTHNLEYLLDFDDFFVQIWAWIVITVKHVYMLTKNNWLSYLHTKAAKMLQIWQYEIHSKKNNSIHMLYWNIQHSFQNIPKKWRVQQFVHCDTNAVISLILLLMKIIVVIRGKKTLPSNKSDSLLWEMYQRL